MKNSHIVGAAVIGAILVSGCSTRPRNFAAAVSTPVIDHAAFENDYRTCQSLVQSGRTSDFKATAAQMTATGAGTMGVGTALYGAGAMGISGGAAAVTMAVPLVGALAGFGVARAIRGGKERKLKRGMSACLGEYGYSVADWEKLPRKADPARFSSNHTATSRSLAIPVEPAAIVPDLPRDNGPGEPVFIPAMTSGTL